MGGSIGTHDTRAVQRQLHLQALHALAHGQLALKAQADQAAVDLEARMADLRHIEADLERVRQSHYEAGDQVNQAQCALYEASAEVGRLEAEIRFVVEGRQRAEARLMDAPIAEGRRSGGAAVRSRDQRRDDRRTRR